MEEKRGGSGKAKTGRGGEGKGGEEEKNHLSLNCCANDSVKITDQYDTAQCSHGASQVTVIVMGGGDGVHVRYAIQCCSGCSTY